MSAPFDAASWVHRAEAIGLVRVTEDAINTSPNVKGSEVDRLLEEWWGGSEAQRELNTRAACAYVRTLNDPERRYIVIGSAGPLSSAF